MGDASNAAVWTGADVFVDVSKAAPGPADVLTPWTSAWAPVGLLDGDEGLTMARAEESSEAYAWGGRLIRRSRRKHKRTITFAALEDNPIVFALANPGSDRSTAGGLTISAVRVPKSPTFSIGFELRDGVKIKRRWVRRAEVESIDDVKESEGDPTVYKVTVVLYPEADGTLYHEVEGPADRVLEAEGILAASYAPDGWIASSPARDFVRPYMASYGAVGLVAATAQGYSPTYLAAAEAWVRWYAANLDGSGFMHDWSVAWPPS